MKKGYIVLIALAVAAGGYVGYKQWNKIKAIKAAKSKIKK